MEFRTHLNQIEWLNNKKRHVYKHHSLVQFITRGSSLRTKRCSSYDDWPHPLQSALALSSFCQAWCLSAQTCLQHCGGGWPFNLWR